MQGLFKLFNRIRQGLSKDWIVSFKGLRKFRVKCGALKANGLVALPISKSQKLQSESLNVGGGQRVQHSTGIRPLVLGQVAKTRTTLVKADADEVTLIEPVELAAA